ncbi:MAG TPA: hypothetical protein VFQ07_14230 [Candidatus Polarisedimenticolia bacterium]|nr:hypothetical protein [Candidatus Polarisedimenticolia bacterium]
MTRHGILVLIAVAFLTSAAGLTIPAMAPSQGAPAAPAAGLALAPVDSDLGQVCSAASDMVPGGQQPEKAPPGCCSTQCNTDRDCNKICGKGVCACLQETSCCRRCVY